MDNPNFKGLTPTTNQLRLLKAKMPQMRGKAAKSGKKILVKGMVDPIPCVICGTMFERYRSDGVKHESCSGCRSRLEQGQVCIISKLTRDCVYDGRYAF